MRTAAIQRCACGGHAPPGGECAGCRARRLAAQSAHVSQTLRGPGRPLDPATRTAFESSLGHDFSRVRIHTDSRAAASAEALEANAYTVGTDVAFGAGRYDPGSAAGRQLLAHELTHVRQQAGATPSGSLQVVDDPAAEAEADRVGPHDRPPDAGGGAAPAGRLAAPDPAPSPPTAPAGGAAGVDPRDVRAPRAARHPAPDAADRRTAGGAPRRPPGAPAATDPDDYQAGPALRPRSGRSGGATSRLAPWAAASAPRPWRRSWRRTSRATRCSAS